MLEREAGNLLSGAVVVAVGVFYAVYAYANYSIGNMRQIGPGLFPVALGVILTGLGLALFLPALFRKAERPKLGLATPLLVLLAVAAFAITIRPFGLIPAVIATTVIASLAELKLRIVSTAILCLVLSVFSWLVFGEGLGLAVPLFRLPSWL